MKVKMLDTVETTYVVALDFEKDGVSEQAGLRVLSRVERELAGLRGCNYVLLLAKGAVLSLPDRLAERLVGIGHAEQA